MPALEGTITVTTQGSRVQDGDQNQIMYVIEHRHASAREHGWATIRRLVEAKYLRTIPPSQRVVSMIEKLTSLLTWTESLRINHRAARALRTSNVVTITTQT
jgi:hypothetical protein